MRITNESCLFFHKILLFYVILTLLLILPVMAEESQTISDHTIETNKSLRDPMKNVRARHQFRQDVKSVRQ
jgi:membrane-anchored glycerophosphoryl diester phosphodiesterase (GDPDase)